jgi:hypothetical protein
LSVILIIAVGRNFAVTISGDLSNGGRDDWATSTDRALR